MDQQKRINDLEGVAASLIASIDHLDRAAWLMRSAVDDGDSEYVDSAVQEYERAHDALYMGPFSPISMARCVLYGHRSPSHEGQ